MYDTALIFAQTIATGSIAAWMFTGVRDNILYPTQNETYTAEVMEMRRIREDFPEAFAPVSHRAVTDRRTQVRAFRAVVIVETLAFVVLALGTIAMIGALFGVVGVNGARAIAIIGAAAFICVWAGMLIVGNHFCYWFGHEGAQMTHFQMNLWGLAVLILLAQG